VARIAQLRDAYARVPEVQSHFREPLRAFDEVIRLNDGGVSYLAKNLAEVCRPGIKQEQVIARLRDLRARMSAALSPFFVPTDADIRLAERLAVAEEVINDFDKCVGRQKFGAFLRGFCLDRERLADALYEARTRGVAAEEETSTAVEPNHSQITSVKRGGLLATIKAGGRPTTPPSASGAPTSARTRARSTRADTLARCALQVWSRTLHEAIEDEALSSSLGLSRSSFKEVATELTATSRRLGLEKSIRDSIASISHVETAEQAVAKATIVAERYVNRFVTSLQSGSIRPPVAFDANGIGEDPSNFQHDFVVGWLSTFYQHVQTNAQTADGLVHDPEQNIRLGEILTQLGTAAPSN
jgi:hypothetical protein